MRKLFPQVVRTAAFDEAGNITGQRVGIGSHEQMHVIGLNRQFDDLPLMFLCHLSNDGLQTLRHWANQHLAASLGTPDDVIHDQMYAVLLMFVVHVDSILHNNSAGQATSTVSLRDGASIPRLKDGGFPRLSVKGPIERFQAELFAAADRFLFGETGHAPTSGPITIGTIKAGACPHCGAHLVLEITDSGSHLVEDDEGA